MPINKKSLSLVGEIICFLLFSFIRSLEYTQSFPCSFFLSFFICACLYSIITFLFCLFPFIHSFIHPSTHSFIDFIYLSICLSIYRILPLSSLSVLSFFIMADPTITPAPSLLKSDYYRGPLTTLFSPPASCFHLTKSLANDGLFFGHGADPVVFDPSCYPPAPAGVDLKEITNWHSYYRKYPIP